jgi:hypothetical protein
MKKNRPTHLILPDAQVKPGVPTEHLLAAAHFAVKHRVTRIVCLGDFWDMPSLSSHDDQKTAEGKRVLADIEAGNKAMREFMAIINRGRKRYKSWKPTLDFIMGNHEQRIQRAIGANPKLEGLIGYHLLALDGWRVHDFLKIVVLDGLHYSHYFANPMSSKPYGGNAGNILAKLGYSFVMGHRQVLEHSRKDLTNGKVIQGLIAGAFYSHSEGYKGHQGNNHWRGICLLHDVQGGNYDLEIISLDRLMRDYLPSRKT